MMSGLDPDKYSDLTWDFMSYGMMRHEEIDYLKLTVIITAIISAGRIASGGDAGESLRKALNSYRSAVFPEVESDLLEKARQNERILEQEHKKGPMKVQSLEYGTKRKRKK